MIKKRSLLIVLIIVCSFSMTSCIGLIEKIFFNNDGSGTYSMTLDMSKAAEMLASLGSDEVNLGLDSLNAILSERAKNMEQIDGISNLRQESDEKTLVFSFLFDFENANALNRGMSEFYKDEFDSREKQFVFFKQDRGRLERTSSDRVKDAIDFALNTDEATQFNPAVLLRDMFYEQEISFKRSIKSISNTEYVQDSGANILRWKKYLFRPTDEKKTVEVVIEVK